MSEKAGGRLLRLAGPGVLRVPSHALAAAPASTTHPSPSVVVVTDDCECVNRNARG